MFIRLRIVTKPFHSVLYAHKSSNVTAALSKLPVTPGSAKVAY